MAIEVRPAFGGRAIVYACSGPDWIEEVLALVEQRYKLAVSAGVVCYVWDMTEAGPTDIESHALRQLVERGGVLRRVHQDRRPIVIIAPSDLGYGMSRMRALLDRAPEDNPVHGFRTWAEAEEFVSRLEFDTGE